MNRNGLSLLEVILATAILLAATVTLGRVAFITTQHAQRAEDRSLALEIAEYQMQRLLLGQLPLQSQARAPVLEALASIREPTSPPHPWDQWQFALQVAATPLPQVYRVQVDVFRGPPGMAPGDPNLATARLSDSGNPNIESGSSGSALGSADTNTLFQYSVVRLVNALDRGSAE